MIFQIQKEIRQLADPQKAKDLMRFFKTGKGQYAEGDKFLGLMVPQTRVLVKKYKDLSLADVSRLIKSEFHEERLLAILILVSQFESGDQSKKEKIFNLYLKNKKYINNWDLVDLSAGYIVGTYLENKNKDILFKLADSKVLWDRRIAMIATFYDIKNGDAKIALRIAEKLLDDQHDLMHKAVGWMLREVGKRCSMEVEEKFLDEYGATMPRTTLRYAIERFSPEKKKYYMELKNKK